MSEELDPDEADAILRFLSGGRRLKYRRGYRPNYELPLVPELLDGLETAILRRRPHASFSQLKRMAQEWESAGFSAREAERWLNKGARPEDVRVAMAFRDAGLGVGPAFASPLRRGIQLTQTFFDLVRDREMTATDVRRVLDRARQAREQRESS